MRKVIKISLKVLSAIVLLLLILALAAALLLNVEGVQNFAVGKATEAISRSLGTRISMDRIAIRGFNRVAVKGFYVEDLAGDTLLYAHDLSAVVSKTALLRNKILLSGIKLDRGKVYLHQPAGGELNISEIVDRITDPDKKGGGTGIVLDGIDITDVAFKYRRERDRPGNGGRKKVGDGIDYDNMILRGVNASSERLEIAGKRITMDLHGVAFTDISGFEVSDMSVGLFTIDDGLLDFEKTIIETPEARLDLPHIILKGASWKDFSDFVNKVRLDVAMERSYLHSRTLSYFIPALPHAADIPLTDLTLTFEGTVNDFGGRIANLTSNGTRFEGAYAVRDVRPTVAEAHFSIDISHLSTDAHGIESIIGELTSARPDTTITNMLNRAGHLSLSGRVEGLLGDFDADLRMDSGLGDATLSGSMESSGGNTTFDGNIQLDRFDVGYLMDNSLLSRVTASVKARGALHGKALNVEGNAAIPSLEFNGYAYENIRLNGTFDNNVISGRASAGDENLRFDLVGRADIRPDTIPKYDLTLDLKRADLHRLNINRRDSVSYLSGLFVVDAAGNSLDNINGTINIDELLYVSPADSVRTGGITFTGRNDSESKYLAFNSSFLDAEFVSRLSYASVIDYLRHILYDYLPALGPEGASSAHHAAHHSAAGGSVGEDVDGSSRVTVNVKQANNVAAIFLPGFSIAEGTHAELLFNPNTERLSIAARSNFMEYDKFLVTKLDLSGDNYTRSDSLSLTFTTEELMFPGFSLPSSHISAQAADNNTRIRAQISNEKHSFDLSLDASARLGRDSKGGLTVEAHFLPSSMTTGASVWSISDESILYSDGRLEIHNFRVTEGSQGLFVDGVISADKNDILTVSLNDLTLSPLSGLINDLGYAIDGTAKGKVAISSALNKPIIDGEVLFDNMMVNGIPVTPLRLGSLWDFGSERANLFLSETIGGRDIVRGYYSPSDGSYSGDIDIAGLPFAAIDPLLGGAVKTSDGSVDIKAEVRSSPPGNTPLVTGSLRINELQTTVDFNQATYRLPAAEVRIDNNVVSLASTDIFDSEGNRAELKAAADLSNFSAISYSANLAPENIIALNTDINDNDLFYGKVYASGAIDLKGDKMGVKVDIAATTGDNSSFFMPLAGGSSVSRTDFLVFESRRDTVVTDENAVSLKIKAFEEARKEDARVQTDVNINMALNVLPNTSVTLILDREESNVMSARGTASLNMTVNPTKNEFSMYGNYEISEGDYVMNFQELISAKLEIQPGGTIQWTGDPANAILDVSAIYRLRASPSGLLNDPTIEVGRVPIECVVMISGRLSEPEFSFAINAPTLDADQQSRLASALSAEGMLPLQFMYLVALGSFYVGDSLNQDLGAATTSAGIGILTNKFSDLISNDRTRFTLDYRAQDAYSSSEVDIGFSTDIVSDRVSVEFETNFDTGDNAAAVGDNSDIMNYNVTVTGILNKAGNLRTKAFTRAIDRFDYDRGLQETGVGVYYREDFDRISDIGRNARERKERRRQAREARREARQKSRQDTEAAQEITNDTTVTDR